MFFVRSLLLKTASRRIYSGQVPLHRAIDEHSGVSTIAGISILAKKPLNLLRRPSTSPKGKTLPVYCTDLPLTLIVVAALSWTTAAMRLCAREYRPAEVQSEHYPPDQILRPMARATAEQRGLALQIRRFPAQRDRYRQQVEATGVSVAKDADRRTFQAAMAGLHRRPALDPATATLIARTRRVT
jgi:hypothetical protein